jgi:hypothetical protein
MTVATVGLTIVTGAWTEVIRSRRDNATSKIIKIENQISWHFLRM